jgi:hypothetical protein
MVPNVQIPAVVIRCPVDPPQSVLPSGDGGGGGGGLAALTWTWIEPETVTPF